MKIRTQSKKQLRITNYTLALSLALSSLARICNPCHYNARITNPREQKWRGLQIRASRSTDYKSAPAKTAPARVIRLFSYSVIQLLLLIALILSGCRTTKDIPASSSAMNLKTEAAFFAAYNDNAFQYNTLSARIQFDIVMSGQEMSSHGLLRMVKDDRIQIYIQPLLGIDVIRAELTPDSIKIVNRLNRWYMLDAFDHIKGDTEIDFNFYNLQDLITNRLFLPGETNLTENKFNLFGWKQTATGYLLHTNDRNGLQYAFTADSNERIVTTEIKDDATRYMLDCNYKNFLPAGGQMFPSSLLIRLRTENQGEHSLTLHFSRVEINVPVTTNFPVPANYQRVSLQQIIHSIEQL